MPSLQMSFNLQVACTEAQRYQLGSTTSGHAKAGTMSKHPIPPPCWPAACLQVSGRPAKHGAHGVVLRSDPTALLAEEVQQYKDAVRMHAPVRRTRQARTCTPD